MPRLNSATAPLVDIEADGVIEFAKGMGQGKAYIAEADYGYA